MVPFYKYRLLYICISGLVLFLGFVSMIRFGYHYSIDFVGETTLQYSLSRAVDPAKVKALLKTFPSEKQVVEMNGKQLTIRLDAQKGGNEDAIYSAIKSELDPKVVVLQAQTVGPTLGAETIRKTLIAALMGVFVIFAYIAFAFKGVRFATAAIVALLHDMAIVLGVYSLFSYFLGAEFDTLFVTALLTTMSFSVHDTIIIFDKIREFRRFDRAGDIETQANRALVQTLTRSVNNSMTIIFMLLALVLMGGVTIRFFVLALLIGTVTGTYSSPFVATPVLVYLEKNRKK
jgi:preprotein translocase subunit SecF